MFLNDQPNYIDWSRDAATTKQGQLPIRIFNSWDDNLKVQNWQK